MIVEKFIDTKTYIRKQIGNQEYSYYDTVSCVSEHNFIYKGILYAFGNNNYIMMIINNKRCGLEYQMVNPVSIVLFEKTFERSRWYDKNLA